MTLGMIFLGLFNELVPLVDCIVMARSIDPEINRNIGLLDQMDNLFLGLVVRVIRSIICLVTPSVAILVS